MFYNYMNSIFCFSYIDVTSIIKTYPRLEYTRGRHPNLARAFFATCAFWTSSSLNGSPVKLNEFDILLMTRDPVCPIFDADCVGK